MSMKTILTTTALLAATAGTTALTSDVTVSAVQMYGSSSRRNRGRSSRNMEARRRRGGQRSRAPAVAHSYIGNLTLPYPVVPDQAVEHLDWVPAAEAREVEESNQRTNSIARFFRKLFGSKEENLTDQLVLTRDNFHLRFPGEEIRDMPADGNCLFHSLVNGLRLLKENGNAQVANSANFPDTQESVQPFQRDHACVERNQRSRRSRTRECNVAEFSRDMQSWYQGESDVHEMRATIMNYQERYFRDQQDWDVIFAKGLLGGPNSVQAVQVPHSDDTLETKQEWIDYFRHNGTWGMSQHIAAFARFHPNIQVILYTMGQKQVYYFGGHGRPLKMKVLMSQGLGHYDIIAPRANAPRANINRRSTRNLRRSVKRSEETESASSVDSSSTVIVSDSPISVGGEHEHEVPDWTIGGVLSSLYPFGSSDDSHPAQDDNTTDSNDDDNVNDGLDGKIYSDNGTLIYDGGRDLPARTTSRRVYRSKRARRVAKKDPSMLDMKTLNEKGQAGPIVGFMPNGDTVYASSESRAFAM